MTSDRKRRLKLHFRRFEFKYLVTPRQHKEIISLFRSQLMPDPYGNGSYTVNSLYFDSPGLRYYRENEAGLEGRQKIRYRYYDDDQANLFWEIKKKISDVVFKDRCLSSRPDSKMEELLRYYKLLHRLRPVLWVKYSREAWQLPGREFRITFDSEMQAARPGAENIYLQKQSEKILPGWVIMELKYTGLLPNWIHRAISNYSLTRRPIGKYRLAVEKLGMVS